MIKVSLFNLENDIYINHKNINTVIVQDEDRLLVKMINDKEIILNMNIDTFIKRVKSFEQSILKFNIQR